MIRTILFLAFGITVMILLQNPETDVLMREVSRVTDNLIPGRRYNNVKVRMPFKV